MSTDLQNLLANAQKLVDEGSIPEAIEAFRRIVEIAPDEPRAHIRLGDLYLRTSDRQTAKESYGRAAAIFASEGVHLKAAAVYKQMLKLAPSDVATQVELAEAYRGLGLEDEAAAALESAYQICVREGRREELIAPLEKLIGLRPREIRLHVQLAEAYSASDKIAEAARSFERAASLLKEAGRRAEYIKVAERLLYHRPDDVVTARALADAYLDEGDQKRALARLQLCFKADPRDTATLRLLARAFLGLGQREKAISVYREIASIHELAGDAAALLEAMHEILEHAPDDEIALEYIAAHRPPPLEAGGPMVQARHYLNEGAYVELIDLLEPLVEANEDYIPARELLLKAYEALGQSDEAVDQLLALAEYYSFDDPGTAERHLLRVLELDPENIEAKLQLKGTSPGEIIASIIPPSLDEHLGEELDLTEGDLRPPAVPNIELPLGAEPEAMGDAFGAGAGGRAIGDETLEAADAIEDELDGFDVEIDIELLGPISPEEFEALPVVEPSSAAAPIAEAEESAIEEILEEAEFYVNQGLLAEAGETLREGLEEFAAHPLLKERLSEIDAELAQTGGAESGGLDETFDLASRLAGEVLAPADQAATDALDAHQIFEQFKEGVAREIDDDDSATHFDLGIAYREMGLHDDAIREFELAARAPLRTCNALTMIGLCQIDAERYDDAIASFEEALRAPHRLEGEIVGLHYEIGRAELLRGERSRALDAFGRVAAMDPSFRDVRARLEALEAARSSAE